jgi:hypothetical protein
MSTSKDESTKQMALASICAFGKAPAKHDDRTLKLKDILRAGHVLSAEHPLPEEYDFDDNHNIPTPRFRNPPDNTCVIAGRAHQTLRFKMAEQGVLIKITDEEVTAEFNEETGGVAQDLETLDSLKRWRTRGWKAAGQNFKIKAFAKLDQEDREQIKRMIYINFGVGLGFDLPGSAIAQFHDGQPWEVTRDKAANGHYVYVPGYTRHGPVCVTWGRKQQMSWDFMDKYSDEAYVIIDDVNTPEKKQNLDEEKINAFLKGCAAVQAKADRISPA